MTRKSIPLSLHDTLTRATQPVLPDDRKTLRFYCCGPTVYGAAHIGNFRTFVIQDVFRRVLEAGGTATLHVRNLTDVDDKTILRSREEGKSLAEFCAHWTARFHVDCAALNLLPPHIAPGAVAHIPEQIALIKRLIGKGHAYLGADGSVYFSIASFPGYGKLSRLEGRSITTSRMVDDEYGRDSAADFVLWKKHRPEDGANHWPSPWGDGRPGWHIECSAMAMKHLGESFDLHSGGVDLIFPHHENEIAQSEAATGKPFARHWFHIAHLLVDGGKMSKSSGTMHTLDDIRALGFSAEELRYVLISGSYRQPLNFTIASLSAARKALTRLHDFRSKLNAASSETDDPFEPVMDALRDDLNTPEALGRLFTIIRQCATENVPAAAFDHVMRTLGFTLEVPTTTAIPAEIEALAAQRWDAKLRRDFAAADTFRHQLATAGWQVADSAYSYQLSPFP